MLFDASSFLSCSRRLVLTHFQREKFQLLQQQMCFNKNDMMANEVGTERQAFGSSEEEEDESRAGNANNLLQITQQQQQPLAPVVDWERYLPVRSLKVLLVENDDSTRHIVTALLKNCSYEGIGIILFFYP